MLKGALDQAGVSAENLSGAELEAFASAMGMSAEETRKMLQQSNAELEIQALSQEEANERAKEAMTIMDELKVAFQQLLIDAKPFIDDVLKPMIRGFAKFTTWIAKMIAGLGDFGNTAIFAGIALAGLTMLIPGMQPLAIAAIGILGGLAVAGIGSAMGGSGPGDNEGSLEGYAQGGTVRPGRHGRGRTSIAMVGEMGPEMVEMPNGANVSTASTTERLTTAMENLSSQLNKLEGGNGEQPLSVTVYIGDEKLDEVLVKSLRSTGMRSAVSPYAAR